MPINESFGFHRGDKVKLTKKALDMDICSRTPNKEHIHGTIKGFRKSSGHPVVAWDYNTKTQASSYHPSFLEKVNA